MIVNNLRSEISQDQARVAATIIWETRRHPAQQIYFKTSQKFAEDLSCNPHAFLTACAMPAIRHGEQRIAIDAEICPELRQGLMTAMNLMRQWYGPRRQPVRIEARTSARLLTPRTPVRTGVFLSGGVDSLASLRANRLDFPSSHPGSFKDALFIQGIERKKDAKHFAPALRALNEITSQDPELNLIPVYTNIRELDDDSFFWGAEFQGAALAAVAHAFTRRLTTVSIPATSDMLNLHPYGSHPMLDPSYSSSDLQIRHDGILLSRLAKTRLIADWDVALQNLRVCNAPRAIKAGALNCGQCEKCLRTKLALLALGKLSDTRAFARDGLSNAALLDKLHIKNRASKSYQESCYRELIAPLAAQGHHDLAQHVERFITRSNAKHRRIERRQRIRDFKATLKRIDRTLLNGSLRRLFKVIGLHPQKSL